MNKSISYSLTIVLLTSTALCNAWGNFSMERVYSFFGKYTNEEVIEKEYRVAKPTILKIRGIDGNITVTTEWKRDAICLKAVKRTAKKEDLEVFSVKTNREEVENEHFLTLTTACSNKAAKGTVDYELIVPTYVALNLHTERGLIKVQDVKGKVAVSTINGTIDLKNINNAIIAQTKENGPISIDGATGDIKATTNKGDIRINDATRSILASTQKGNIITTCNNVSSSSKIVLNSEQQGGITLALPSSVNATLIGKTEKGRLTSDHYVTIKPFTCKLDRQTRKDFERQVDGVIGTGEADIRLTSNNGHIRILETKTT